MNTATGLRAVGRQAEAALWSQRAVDAVSSWLSARTSRRGFLTGSALVGSAIAINGADFLLKPQSAYASVCGSGSSCSSGWTVFCATINKGVNACPPGSIAAGWWKADGASLCGGKARYIVDCNATCSRCSSGGARAGICSSSCWSCHCTCGPAGQCDQRRVCCNAFRYGQCNQGVRQVGAVQCRVVSCIPPWTFANCSTATATDNRTRDHNSPALPGAWSPITAHYLQVGERKSPLGATIYGEFAVSGGRAQRYFGGRMSWASSIGAHYTAGSLTTLYAALGAEAGALGYPVADPLGLGTGRASRFQRGRISYHPTIGTFETLGAMAVRYQAAGNESGRLGYPTRHPIVPADGKGRASTFQHGRISWHPSIGARLVGAPIAARYVVLKAESGRLGYPLQDETAVATGIAAVVFQRGRIAWSTATGAIEMYDVIAAAYVRSGAEQGRLGLPVAVEQPILGSRAQSVELSGRAQRFQTGRISAGDAGAFFTRGPITTKYVQLGAETGKLGWPTTDEYVPAARQRRSDFQHGSINYDEVTGDVTVLPLP